MTGMLETARSRSSVIVVGLGLALFAGQCPESRAGVIRHDRLDSIYRLLASDEKYDPVGKLQMIKRDSSGDFQANCSCTLVAPQYVLTAAHCLVAEGQFIQGTVSFGSRMAAVQSYDVHPNFNPTGSQSAGWDLAVIKLTEPIAGIRPATRFNGSDERELAATMVGYGMSGTGLTGANIPAGTKRAGQNVLDIWGTQLGASQTLVYMDFDHPGDTRFSTTGSEFAVNLEYLPFQGDSGGPAFVESGGVPRVAGVLSFNRAFAPRHPHLTGQYGDLAAATRVALFNGWIDEQIGGVNWNNMTVGSFGWPDNWGAGRVPTASDDVRFSVPHEHLIGFTNHAASRNVIVENGTAGFTLEGYTYSIENLLVGSADGYGGNLLIRDGALEVSNQLQIAFFGNGGLRIQDGAMLSNAGLVGIGVLPEAFGVASVSGGGTIWSSAGQLGIGIGGTGTLAMELGARVESAKADSPTAASAILGLESGSKGTATVTGSGTEWAQDGGLNVGFRGTGELHIEDGASVSSDHGIVGRFATAQGTVTVTGSGSVWQNSGSLFVGGSEGGAGGVGTLSISSGGSVSAGNLLKTWESGSVQLSGGNLTADTFDLTAGQLNMTGGRLAVEEITGNLSIEGGTLSPGALSGKTTVTGDYAQQFGATLEINIGGSSGGTHFDVLSVSGAATLAGLLDVSLINDFIPTPGQQFEVLTAGSIVDEGLTLGGTAAELFDLLVGGTSVILQAVGAALPGDFNHDGRVDAADYVVWRKSDSTADEYDQWRTNFGVGGGAGGAGSSRSLDGPAAVPEPAGFALLLIAITSLAGSSCARCKHREHD